MRIVSRITLLVLWFGLIVCTGYWSYDWLAPILFGHGALFLELWLVVLGLCGWGILAAAMATIPWFRRWIQWSFIDDSQEVSG